MPWNVDVKQDYFTFLSMCWLLMNYIYDFEGWSRSWSPRPRELVWNWVTWSYCLLGHCKSGMCKTNEPRAMRKLRLIPVWLYFNTSRSERSILVQEVHFGPQGGIQRFKITLWYVQLKVSNDPILVYTIYHMHCSDWKKKKHLCNLKHRQIWGHMNDRREMCLIWILYSFCTHF